MIAFFKKYLDQALVAFAVILLIILAAFYLWGFSDITASVNRVFNFSTKPATGSQFDLQGASKLDLKGLIVATSS